MTNGTTVPVAPVKSQDELKAEMAKAYAANDFLAVSKISKLLAADQISAEKAKRDEALKGRAELTSKSKAKWDVFAQKMIDSGAYDGCDGIWYTKDFGSTDSSLCLFKEQKTKRAAGESKGGGAGKKFAITTKELLNKYGNQVVGDSAGTEMVYMVDGKKVEWSAETTWNEMNSKSTNGNWNYFKVRKPLLKLEGLI
jgi:hypothetical protein